jgi:flagellar motility protein MotE (MotC chaperone)
MSLSNFARSRSPRPRLLREQEAPSGWSAGPAIRLLPAVIVAGVFMLGFRVQVVVQNMAHTKQTSVELSSSAALAQNAAPPAAPAPAPAKDAAAPKEGAAPAETTDEQKPADAEATTPAFDPSTLTKSEIDTLQRLAERRDIIETRERELVAKDGLMKAAEARIDGKIAQLQDLEKNIKVLLTQYDQQKDSELEQLKNIYAAMKPKDAAGIFDTLDMPILVGLVNKMGVRQSAPIMALMSREKATALTEELTSRKQLDAASMASPGAPAPGAPAR